MDYSSLYQPSYQLAGLPPTVTTPPLLAELTEDSRMSHTTIPFEYNNNYNASFNFPASGTVLRPQPHSQTDSPSDSVPHNSLDVVPEDLGQYLYSDFIEDPFAPAAHGEARDSSEEKDAATPAQNRRKAQNRAAQRAFRERKERRVRELEQKLTDLQAKSMTLHADNERLKRELAKIVTENEILRATSATMNSVGGSGNGADNFDEGEQQQLSREKSTTSSSSSGAPTINGPKKFGPLDVRKSYPNNYNKSGNLPHRIVVSAETGDRLLNSKSTWDFIQNHPLFKQGLIDIGDVCERLKVFTKCDGQGPVFEEGRILKVIEESVASGNDELI